MDGGQFPRRLRAWFASCFGSFRGLDHAEIVQRIFLSLIRTVRSLESERGGTIPALALTGYASAEDAARARVAGYETHMTKPVAPSELVVAVASLVAESSVNKKSA